MHLAKYRKCLVESDILLNIHNLPGTLVGTENPKRRLFLLANAQSLVGVTETLLMEHRASERQGGH